MPDDWADYHDARAAWEAANQAKYAAVTDRRLLAVLDVLAPVRHDPGFDGARSPVFEHPHETTPTADEVIELATDILASLDRAGG
jgi:hypothetical protein